jgi:hypothetical protein
MENKPGNELDLPLVKSDPAPPSVRTVDEVNQWIEQDYRYFFDRAVYEKEKRLNSVNVPFVL